MIARAGVLQRFGVILALWSDIGPCHLPGAWMLLQKAHAEDNDLLQVWHPKEEAARSDLIATRCRVGSSALELCGFASFADFTSPCPHLFTGVRGSGILGSSRLQAGAELGSNAAARSAH
jgi:hypothetical protein